MYIVQTVIHSITASLIVEGALISWNIRAPYLKQWFRMMIVFIPVIAFPIYQVISPHRGDVYFRLNSLFDSHRLFFFEIYNNISLSTIFFLALALTALIFIIQEFVPIASDILQKKHDHNEKLPEEINESFKLKISEALNGLPFDVDGVEILNDEDLMLFSATGMKPKIFVTTGLLEAFSIEHLNVAFAHEIAHIHRSRRPILILAYLFRVLMLYNPVAMFEFRRLAQEEEKVCDDIAINLTGKPNILIEAIEMLMTSTDEIDPKTNRGKGSILSAIEIHSYNIMLKNRIHRIKQYNQEDIQWWGIPYFLTLIIILCINYFIV